MTKASLVTYGAYVSQIYSNKSKWDALICQYVAKGVLHSLQIICLNHVGSGADIQNMRIGRHVKD
jgi:hypothetical protein